MCEDNWTEEETDRQDRVDNTIFSAIKEITPIGYAQWDMELIGEVRDVIMEYVVNQKKWMTEQQFYPYRELQPGPNKDGNIILEPSGFVINDQFGDMTRLLEDSIAGLDAQEYGDLVGEMFGGTCRYIGEYKYRFIPNSDYQGGLDGIKDKKDG